MDHQQRFLNGPEQRARWRTITKRAYQDSLYPCFQVKRDHLKALAYSVEYCWLPSNLYLTLSHSWEDRTGPGNAVIVDDLAPWPLTMSPAKTHLLKWLDRLQDHAAAEGGSAWFWLDLVCIDQSWEDEPFSAMQIQMIPEIFGQANGCLALLVSDPCTETSEFAERSESTSSRFHDSDSDWEDLERWVKAHHDQCRCSLFVDAWMTRVWTRQELLYSRSIAFYPAREWLVDCETTIDASVWQRIPFTFQSMTPREGIREFASCLYTWATKNNRILSSTEIAAVARILLRGETAVLQVPDMRPSPRAEVHIEEWFALNWTIIQNGSIRRTSWAVDAILSQMLLLPGYVTPPLPRTTSLQEIARDASIQFRRLVRSYQLIPRDLSTWNDSGTQLLRNVWHAPTQPTMSDILEGIGSPCQLVRSQVQPPNRIDVPLLDSSASILAYQPAGKPSYRVVQELDVFTAPDEAIGFFIHLAQFWNYLKGHATEYRIRTRLKKLSDTYGYGQDQDQDPDSSSPSMSMSMTITSPKVKIPPPRDLIEIVWCVLDPLGPALNPNSNQPPRARPDSEDLSMSISGGGRVPVPVPPPLRAVQITYSNSNSSSDPNGNTNENPNENENENKPPSSPGSESSFERSHIALLFGALPLHSTGPVFSLGIDKAHGCEVGVVGEVLGREDDGDGDGGGKGVGVLKLQGFGALLPRRENPKVEEETSMREKFYRVTGGQFGSS